MNRKLYTLVFVSRGQDVLLGYKKRGFGEGKWNGFGGKVEEGETILAAAKREMEEESKVKCDALSKAGVLLFEFEGNPKLMEVHVFKSTTFQGTPQETEEMTPRWFKMDNIPFEKMWPDDAYWWPYMLEDKKFDAYFKYKGFDTITEHKIIENEHI